MKVKNSQPLTQPPTLAELPLSLANKRGWPWTVEPAKLARSALDNKSWPKISVVTPSFNQGQYLEETIRSVLLQGYPNLEYIIIDGGSTDNSLEIIKRYEPWLFYWESEHDRGQGHAINKGFSRATGQIMSWLNSDDIYHEGALNFVAMKLVHKQRALLVGTSVITTGPSELKGRLDKRQPSWDEMVYEACSFPQPSVFWSRSLWSLVRPMNEDLNLALDYDLWLRMRQHAQDVLFTDRSLSYARSHDNQKAQRERREGKSLPSLHEKAFVALEAAKRRHEHPIVWLLRSWQRRWKQAIKTRKMSLVRGSQLQHIALRLILKSYLQNKEVDRYVRSKNQNV